MRFTKLGHSCVRLEKDGATLVIDPGTFTDAPAALAGAAAVMVTHEHPDHLDADAIRAALSGDPDLTHGPDRDRQRRAGLGTAEPGQQGIPRRLGHLELAFRRAHRQLPGRG
jgi:L-ascorbate metabolism protein UlaG (beta-lactamase superfamily)